MSNDINLYIKYNIDSVVIFEVDDGEKYEVIKWTEKDLETTENLPIIINEIRQMLEANPKNVIRKYYGSVDEWNQKKQA